MNLTTRIEKLEQITGANRRLVSRWCVSDEDADRQYAEMKANGELEGVARVQFVRWLTLEEAAERAKQEP